MIQTFKDAGTQKLLLTGKHRNFANFAKVALRKLDQIHAAARIEDLKDPPGNRLEPLRGDRNGQYSLRINNQFRICFEWRADGAYDVEIVDYH